MSSGRIENNGEVALGDAKRQKIMAAGIASSAASMASSEIEK